MGNSYIFYTFFVIFFIFFFKKVRKLPYSRSLSPKFEGMKSYLFFTIILFFLLACKADSLPGDKEPEKEPSLPSGSEVQVTEVEITGSSDNYTFNVRLSSPDTGCDQYADWWEVFRADGSLVYRRILAHSHVSEQPFSRGGGPVKINPSDSIYVRGHMNNLGYGSQVFKGTVSGGLTATRLDTAFASNLAEQNPLPDRCAF